MANLRLWLESKDALDVRSFRVREALSSPFEVALTALSPNDDLDLEAPVGREAIFLMDGVPSRSRHWKGIVSYLEQAQPEKAPQGGKGLSTYVLRIVPKLWVATHRRSNRIFQHLSTPEIVLKLLREYGIAVEAHFAEDHPKHDYRVQYGESDFTFISRLLEEAGISYAFEPVGSALPFEPIDPTAIESRLLLDDSPHKRERHVTLPYADNPNHQPGKHFVSSVRVSHQVRPGKFTIRDYDFKKPDFQLYGRARPAPPEDFFEQYHYEHGAFTTEKAGGQRATVGLEAARHPKRRVAFGASALDLGAGVVFGLEGHPRKDLGSQHGLLVAEAVIEGTSMGEWSLAGEAVFSALPYRPVHTVPPPRMPGLQSAVVVGPKGEEIYTDEFGRVKVQFHWDREGRHDEDSSCWVRVSHGWGGAAFGMMAVPRVGQEVIIGFWEGNPDQPLIVGRAYNMKQQVPFKLPEDRTKTTLRSQTTPGGGGHNEITMEDRRGEEMLFFQAERDMQHLVKRDRTTRIHRVDSSSIGQHYKLAIAKDGAGSSSTFLDMQEKVTKLVSGMAMVILEGDSVTITGLTVNIIGMAEVNIVGGKIKLNC